MSRDEFKVGVPFKKLVIMSIKHAKICYRSVCNHPFAAFILLFLLFLYRSSPFLFSLLVSASPVLVCTAVLLGTLLSFGDPSGVPSFEEDEHVSREIVGLKTTRVKDTIAVEEDEHLSSKSSVFTDLRREIVKKIDEEPLLDNIDKNKYEKDHDDIDFSSVCDDRVSREVRFEKQWSEELKSEVVNKESENTKIEETVDLSDQLIRTRDEVGLSDGEPLQTKVSTVEKVQAEHSEDYKSAEGSVDAQMSELLMSLELRKRLDEVVSNSLSSSQNVQHENFEDYISAEGSVDAQALDQLEPSLASWKQFDDLDDGLSPTQADRDVRFEDYQLAEESTDIQMSIQLESSLRSWERFGSDRDEDDESDYGSDGAESSSPDASMADIIPMLHELDPLLEDEIPLVSDLSRQNSAVKSPGSSIHSDDESDQWKEEGDDGKSEADDDNEDETEGDKEDPEKSAVMWTEDDQKNLMDLGTSELERNQRLESLIARRRARKMAADRNLMDLDGMDIPFPVAPISTRKHNPFDFPHDSCDDLGLPPIPGSAPSIMLARRNPFDLPYDSSEEKPDLTGDGFQQEFSELTQREAYTQREALFRRNETFNLGSSAFDFGRPSRFRPYFIPERSDSDVMSYCSLQRQFSELSESKASSAGETDMASVGPDQEEKKLTEPNSSEVAEPTSEIDHASLLVECGSQSADDLDSLSGDDKQKTDSVQIVPEVELGGANSHFEDSHSDIQSRTALIEVKHNISSSVLSVPKVRHEVEDVSSSLVHKEQSQVNDVLSLEIPEKCSPEPSVSDITDQSLEAIDQSYTTAVDNDHLKEPIYDLSPLKKDLSLSSSSSDLQREISGIDIYHLSRDLFVVEEAYVHNKHSANVSRHPEQVEDENSLKPNDISEGCELHSTDLKLNEVLGKSQVSAEDEGHLSIYTSERGIEEKLLDDDLSSDVVDKASIPGDSSKIYHENSLDADSSDDTISSGGLEFLEESIMIQDELQGELLEDNALAGHSVLSCSTAELTEQVGMEMKLNQPSLVPSLESRDVDATEKLNFSLDENHFLSHDANVDDNSAELLEQERSMMHRELEEVGQVSKVDESVNILMVQEPELSNLSDTHQTTVSYEPEESATNPIVELAAEDDTQINKLDDPVHVYKVQEPQLDNPSDSLVSSSQHEESAMNPIVEFVVEDHTHINKLDDPISFKVQEPQLDDLSDSLQTTVSYSEPEESATNPVVELAVEDHTQEIAETRDAYTPEEDIKISKDIKGSISDELAEHEKNSDMKEMDEALLSELDAVGDFSATNMVQVNSDNPAGVLGDIYSTTDSHTEDDVLETKESNLESQAVDVSASFLAFEAHSVEDIDAAFKRVSEEVRNSGASESFHVESTGKDVEVSVLERESMSEDTEQERYASEDIEPARIQPDVSLLEGKNHGVDFGISVRVAMIVEQSSEDVEKVAEENSNFDIEALQTVPETGSGVEFMPSISREIKEIDESPRVEETSSVDVGPGDETKSVACSEIASSQIDRDIKGVQEPILAESSNPLALEFEYGEEVKQNLFDEEISSLAVKLRYETESVGSIEFASSQIDRDIEGVQEPILVDSSKPLGLESEDGVDTPKMPVHGASIEYVAEYENHSERNTTQPPPPLGEDNEAIQKSTLVSEVNQREVVESSESLELDINIPEVLESPVSEASVPSALEFEEEKKVVQSLESESLTLDEESGKIQDSLIPGGSIVSSLDFKEEEVVGSSVSEPLLMHEESEKVQDPNALEECIASSSDSEEEKEVGESLNSEASLLDDESEKIEVAPLVRPSNASSLENEEEKGVIEYLESEPLHDTVAEELREWHVIEESRSVAVESGDPIERTNLIESHPLEEDANFEQILDLPTVPTTVASASESGDNIMMCNSGETGPLMMDRDIGKLPELTGVNEKLARAIEPEGQLERFYSVGFEFLQMVGDCKEIEETSVLQTSCTSIVEDKDETEISSQMEDHQLAPQHQREGGLPNTGSDIHSDSSTIVGQLSNTEVVQGKSIANSENISSQVEEISHDSHLEISSSFSSSSSSDSDKN